MALDVPDTQELADFTGRPVSAFNDKNNAVTSALNQAVLLFVIATCLDEWPSDELGEQLARYGVLSQADALYISSLYAREVGKPFTSESIGSYSYSKAAGAVAGKMPTGVSWFDMAVDRLSACEGGGGVYSTSVSVFESSGLAVDAAGQRYKPGPSDMAYGGWPFDLKPPDGAGRYESGLFVPWWVTTS